MGQFQVLFSGEVVEGAQEAQVRMNLSHRFGLDDRKIGQLFSGRTVVIESGMERDRAYVLQKELIDLGAVVRVKDLTPEAERGPKMDARDYKGDNDHHADYTLNDITAAHIECPRCGHLQLDTPACARCGIDMASASTQKREEDRRIERQVRQLHNDSGGPSGAAGARRTASRSTRSTRRPGQHSAGGGSRGRKAPRRGLLSRLGFGRG